VAAFASPTLDERVDRKVKPLEIEHFAIDPTLYQTSTFYKYLKDEIKRKKLSYISYNRPFEHIFHDNGGKESTKASQVSKDKVRGDVTVTDGFTSGTVVIL